MNQGMPGFTLYDISGTTARRPNAELAGGQREAITKMLVQFT